MSLTILPLNLFLIKLPLRDYMRRESFWISSSMGNSFLPQHVMGYWFRLLRVPQHTHYHVEGQWCWMALMAFCWFQWRLIVCLLDPSVSLPTQQSLLGYLSVDAGSSKRESSCVSLLRRTVLLLNSGWGLNPYQLFSLELNYM